MAILAIELSTVMRLSGALELGALVNIEKAAPSCLIEASHVQLKFISTPIFAINSSFQTFIKQFLGTYLEVGYSIATLFTRQVR